MNDLKNGSVEEKPIINAEKAVIPERTPRKTPSFFKDVKSIIAIILTLFLALIVTVYIFNSLSDLTQTKKAPKTVFDSYGDNGLKKVSEAGLVEIVNKTVKKGSDTVTLKNTYYDKSRVSVSLVAKSKEMIAKEFDYQFYYNGKPFQASAIWSKTGRVIDGKQYDVVSLNVFDKLPKKFYLKIVATKYGVSGETFNFLVPVDRSRADVITKDISIMKSFSSEPRNALVKSILFTPSSTVVRYKCTSVPGETSYSPQLRDQQNKLVAGIGGGGATLLNAGVKTQDYEYYRIYDPISPAPGTMKLKFTFVNRRGLKTPLAAQFEIPEAK